MKVVARFALVLALGIFAPLASLVGPTGSAGVAQAVTVTRILITGDSITQGSAGDYTWRFRLWQKLATTAPGATQFVGTRSDVYDNVSSSFGSNAYAIPFAGDAHGAKWGGSFANDGAGITSMVNSTSPNVLVEMLGSNDLAYLTSPAETIANLKTYIAAARAAQPGIDIVVGKVLTRYDPWAGTTTLGSETSAYASLLTSMAAGLNTSSERVVVADTSNGWNPQTMTWDGTHPNPTGEALIAQRVSEALATIGVGAASPNIATSLSWQVPGPKPGAGAGIEESPLTWQRNSTGATGMYIEQRLVTLDPNQAWTKLPYAVGGEGWTSSGLAAGGDYQFRLRPSKGFSEGTAGPSTSVTVGSKPIGAVTAVNATASTASDGAAIANTSWSAATNATDYMLASQDFTKLTGWEELPYGFAGTNWTFTYMYPGNKYKYRITPHRGFVRGTSGVSGLIRMKGFPDPLVQAILGDSYSSGLGSNSPQESGDCKRSTGAWGFKLLPLYAQVRIQPACAGKTTSHVVSTQIPQMTSLFNANPGIAQLVTMTIGGNDVGFSDEAIKCIKGSCVGDKATMEGKIDALQSTLQSTYTSVKNAAPYADIIVGGYPGVIQTSGTTTRLNVVCLGVGNDERVMIDGLAARLNTVIYNAANAAGVWSVGQRVYNLFAGHNACSNNDEYIHAANLEIVGGDLLGVIDAKTLHPNDGGQYWYSSAFDLELKAHAN